MQVKEGGTRNTKLLEISKYVMQQFQNAHLKSIPIHDIDIKRWTLHARNEIKLPRKFFTALSKWIYNFKIKHGISYPGKLINLLSKRFYQRKMI